MKQKKQNLYTQCGVLGSLKSYDVSLEVKVLWDANLKNT